MMNSDKIRADDNNKNKPAFRGASFNDQEHNTNTKQDKIVATSALRTLNTGIGSTNIMALKDSTSSSSSSTTMPSSMPLWVAEETTEAKILPRRSFGIGAVQKATKNYYLRAGVGGKYFTLDEHIHALFPSSGKSNAESAGNNNSSSSDGSNNSSSNNSNILTECSSSSLPPRRLSSRAFVNVAAESTSVSRSLNHDDHQPNKNFPAEDNLYRYNCCHPLWKVHTKWESSVLSSPFHVEVPSL